MRLSVRVERRLWSAAKTVMERRRGEEQQEQVKPRERAFARSSAAMRRRLDDQARRPAGQGRGPEWLSCRSCSGILHRRRLQRFAVWPRPRQSTVAAPSRPSGWAASSAAAPFLSIGQSASWIEHASRSISQGSQQGESRRRGNFPTSNLDLRKIKFMHLCGGLRHSRGGVWRW